MADNTLSTWQPFLLELESFTQELFSSEAVLLAELSGFEVNAREGAGGVNRLAPVQRITKEMDGNRQVFTGRQVRVPLITAGYTAGGAVSETSTWNVPHALQDDVALINLVRNLVPFSLSVDVERDSMDHSMATAVSTMVTQTRSHLARIENYQLHGAGDGKVADITGGTTGTLVIQVGTAGNLDILVPGSVWDIITKSTGANPGNGLRRKIVSIQNEGQATCTLTFDTNAVASDGNSGNITFSTNEGIYIPGYPVGTTPTAGTLYAQGLEQAAATTGTFENVNKANVVNWQGTDGRLGDTSTLPLSSTMLDQAVRRGRRSGLGKWDLGIGDPAAIDIYKQSLYSLVRYKEDTITLKSGFSGIVYDGADAPIPMVKEPHAKKAAAKLIDKKSFQLYGDKIGPAFLEDDGAMFRRFNRTLAKEADMLDRWQLGVLKCNTIVFLNNLQIS